MWLWDIKEGVSNCQIVYNILDALTRDHLCWLMGLLKHGLSLCYLCCFFRLRKLVICLFFMLLGHGILCKRGNLLHLAHFWRISQDLPQLFLPLRLYRPIFASPSFVIKREVSFYALCVVLLESNLTNREVWIVSCNLYTGCTFQQKWQLLSAELLLTRWFLW